MTQTETETPESMTDKAPTPPEPDASDDDQEEQRRNERSTISFPYGSLEDAEEVAKAVHEWGGHDVSQDQLAAALTTTVKSSGFRTKLATARVFGVIDGRGEVSLT